MWNSSPAWVQNLASLKSDVVAFWGQRKSNCHAQAQERESVLCMVDMDAYMSVDPLKKGSLGRETTPTRQSHIYGLLMNRSAQDASFTWKRGNRPSRAIEAYFNHEIFIFLWQQPCLPHRKEWGVGTVRRPARRFHLWSRKDTRPAIRKD